MIDNLLKKTNEELCEWFFKEIIEAKPDPERERRLQEYHDNIERDFQEEWYKKHFKWLLKKRRQAKLRAKVTHRYAGPVFWLIEEIIEDTLPKTIDRHFQQFVDFKDVALGDKYFFKEEEEQ